MRDLEHNAVTPRAAAPIGCAVEISASVEDQPRQGQISILGAGGKIMQYCERPTAASLWLQFEGCTAISGAAFRGCAVQIPCSVQNQVAIWARRFTICAEAIQRRLRPAPSCSWGQFEHPAAS